ncbi:TonB-dependent receptor [Flavobacteriaceae bacterium]|nr:TonB-dependent receptor [Flavobacteriaceae bacterium]
MKFLNKIYKGIIIAVVGVISFPVLGQNELSSANQVQVKDSVIESLESLDEVVLSGTRLMIPFSEQSRSIITIEAEQIQSSPASSLAELLQQEAGVDIRRRGPMGSQADLYIRGGSFDQTLLLIDGIKLEDAQTGHHTLNAALPLELIERIEIIKGPAARVYGQNAFTGAINIVTKSDFDDALDLRISGGSFEQINGGFTVYKSLDNSAHMVNVSRYTSRGYRYNTDYDQSNYTLKSTFNKRTQPINFLASLSERAFGANGFYASPAATDQFESTQTSLVGVQTQVKRKSWIWTPRVYWRRNQDEYIYLRNDPTVYRNLHTTNKLAAELHGQWDNAWGTTGIGLDLAQTYLSSNNLGNRSRFASTLFIEHRLKFFQSKLDVIPGIAATSFSDFGTYAYPGVDLGYAINRHWRIYSNMGYTYRIPTYTDLFYSDPNTLGDADLEPEKALAYEVGLRLKDGPLTLNAAWFRRDANNLIDYVKNNTDDLWQAANVRGLLTQGWEANIQYALRGQNMTHNFQLSYTQIDDNLSINPGEFSRYSINSFKHRALGQWRTLWSKQWESTIIHKYGKREGQEAFNVTDVSLLYHQPRYTLRLAAENIFGTDYSETNLVPMPKGVVLLELIYKLMP